MTRVGLGTTARCLAWRSDEQLIRFIRSRTLRDGIRTSTSAASVDTELIRAFGRTAAEGIAEENHPPDVRTRDTDVAFLLWLLAVVLVVGGIATMLRGAVLYGLALVIVGFLVGPGGVSVFS